MNNNNIQEKLEKIRQSYIATLDEKRVAIDKHWCSLTNHWNEDAQDAMYMIIHGIAGSAETFGFPELTQQARIVLNHLKRVDPDQLNAQPFHDANSEMLGLLKILETINES